MNDTLRGIIAEHFDVPLSAVQDDTPFATLGADSLKMIDLIFTIEHETGQRLREDKVGMLEHVSDLMKLYEDSAA